VSGTSGTVARRGRRQRHARKVRARMTGGVDLIVQRAAAGIQRVLQRDLYGRVQAFDAGCQ